MAKNKLTLLFFLTILLFCEIIIACGLGYIEIPPFQILTIIYHSITGLTSVKADSTAALVVLDVRLPRIICAVFIGGSLAVAGCVFQAVLLNPLADPYTLGVSSGAAFGASLILLLGVFGLTQSVEFLVPVAAFVFALLTLYFVFSLSSADNYFANHTLILSGVIVAAILSAAIGFLKYLADENVNIIIFWLMGSLTGKNWSEISIISFTMIPVLSLLFFYSKEMNILSFGHKTAVSLGVDAIKLRKLLLASATLLTAVCVSVSGIIGFVGLIIPHLLRTVLGPDNRVLVPASFLGGGLLLLSADTISRVFLPNEIPIGVLTALIGGPFFCYIFKKRLNQQL